MRFDKIRFIILFVFETFCFIKAYIGYCNKDLITLCGFGLLCIYTSLSVARLVKKLKKER